jgi:hypothetical protein
MHAGGRSGHGPGDRHRGVSASRPKQNPISLAVRQGTHKTCPRKSVHTYSPPPLSAHGHPLAHVLVTKRFHIDWAGSACVVSPPCAPRSLQHSPGCACDQLGRSLISFCCFRPCLPRALHHNTQQPRAVFLANEAPDSSRPVASLCVLAMGAVSFAWAVLVLGMGLAKRCTMTLVSVLAACHSPQKPEGRPSTPAVLLRCKHGCSISRGPVKAVVSAACYGAATAATLRSSCRCTLAVAGARLGHRRRRADPGRVPGESYMPHPADQLRQAFAGEWGAGPWSTVGSPPVYRVCPGAQGHF